MLISYNKVYDTDVCHLLLHLHFTRDSLLSWVWKVLGNTEKYGHFYDNHLGVVVCHNHVSCTQEMKT